MEVVEDKKVIANHEGISLWNRLDALIAATEDQKRIIDSQQSRLDTIVNKHERELLSINTKLEWLCKKWHFVRAAALDDWAEISTNAQYRTAFCGSKMRYECHEYVHGGDVTLNFETITSFPTEADRLECWKKVFASCYGVPYYIMVERIADLHEMMKTILNRRASAHKMNVFREEINARKNLGPRIIEAIRQYFKTHLLNPAREAGHYITRLRRYGMRDTPASPFKFHWSLYACI